MIVQLRCISVTWQRSVPGLSQPRMSPLQLHKLRGGVQDQAGGHAGRISALRDVWAVVLRSEGLDLSLSFAPLTAPKMLTLHSLLTALPHATDVLAAADAAVVHAAVGEVDVPRTVGED